MKLGYMKKSLLILGLCGTIALAPASLQAANDDSPIALAKKLNQAFVGVAKKVRPSVVVVKVKQKVDVESNLRRFRNNPFFEFFGEDMQEELKKRMEERGGRVPQQQGQGSGVIIRKDGYILTNRHVVEEADEIEVVLQDGRSYDAKVQGLDPGSDLAVLKIEANNLPAARFADSDKASVGEFAIAIGAPFELDYSVTIGHISAKGRSIYARDLTDADFIQTDASINPGNSGGPLVNIDGDVIGINTMIRGLGTGIGFAIPSNLAQEITDSLISYGKVNRAWLGIGINSLREDPTLRRFYPKAKEGVVVTDILRGGPASDSDLETQDLITEVAGKKVATIQQLKNEIRSKKIGAPLALTVNRGGKALAVTVKPGLRPSQDELMTMNRGSGRRDDARAPEKELGIAVEEVAGRQAQRLGAKGDSAVVVSEVQEGSIAAESGLSAGDVITNINGEKVQSIRDLRDALSDADLEDGVSIQFLTEDGGRFRVLRKR